MRRGATRTARAPSARSAPRPELWRFECRRPGADANPYLVLAAIAAAGGRDQNGGSPPAPIGGDAYALDQPATGLARGRAPRVRGRRALREALGKDGDYYAISRAWELKAWRETVTEWERAIRPRRVTREVESCRAMDPRTCSS